jgi:uncharacterized protein YciI
MKQFLAGVLLALLFVAVPTVSRAQEKKAPEFKLIEFHMALLKRGPKWTGNFVPGTDGLEAEQRAYVSSLLESGKAVIAGRLGDDGELRGVYILRAKSAEEARDWAEASPGVKAGLLVAEMHPWWSEDVMKRPTSFTKMTTAYLGFLKRGEKWTPEKTPATAELQKAHLANINRLAEMKKLVVAGPFGDDGQLRGIFVFKVASLAEAKVLAETDPAVQAGRLAIEMHEWTVPEGILP